MAGFFISPPPNVTYQPGSGFGGTPTGGTGTGTYVPPPQPTTTPIAPVPPDAISDATGIDPNEVASATYGKIIPIWVGGMVRLGCHIIFGPNFTIINNITHASFGVSFGMPANNLGTRELRELRLDGFKVWTLATGNLIPNLTFRFYGGTETQTADPLVTAMFPTAAVAHRGQCCVFIENLPLTDFGGLVPFVSALIADTTGAGDPEDGLLLGDALEQLAGSPYVDLADDFETVDISERVDALIVAERVSFIDLLGRFARLHLWDIVQQDKLRVIERGTVTPDLAIDLSHIVSAGEDAAPIVIERRPQSEVQQKLEYSFIDSERDMEINTVTAKHARTPVAMTTNAGTETVALPVVHTTSEAIAWATLRNVKDELAREIISLTTSIYGYELEPGDIVAVDAGFKTYDIRVLESVKGANWTNRIKGEPVLTCDLPAYVPVAYSIGAIFSGEGRLFGAGVILP
jgi:hypothetical protein